MAEQHPQRDVLAAVAAEAGEERGELRLEADLTLVDEPHEHRRGEELRDRRERPHGRCRRRRTRRGLAQVLLHDDLVVDRDGNCCARELTRLDGAPDDLGDSIAHPRMIAPRGLPRAPRGQAVASTSRSFAANSAGLPGSWPYSPPMKPL